MTMCFWSYYLNRWEPLIHYSRAHQQRTFLLSLQIVSSNLYCNRMALFLIFPMSCTINWVKFRSFELPRICDDSKKLFLFNFFTDRSYWAWPVLCNSQLLFEKGDQVSTTEWESTYLCSREGYIESRRSRGHFSFRYLRYPSWFFLLLFRFYSSTLSFFSQKHLTPSSNEILSHLFQKVRAGPTSPWSYLHN